MRASRQSSRQSSSGQGSSVSSARSQLLDPPSQDRIEVAVDEAGRGALAFEVCAAAVVLPGVSLVEQGVDSGTYTYDTRLHLLKDSKKLTPRKREEAAEFVKEFASEWAVGTASPAEIDEHNILNATHLAMHRALDGVARARQAKGLPPYQNILVDGDRFKPYLYPHADSKEPGQGTTDPDAPMWTPHTLIPNGDATKMSIAAASILAKTHRDKLVMMACDSDNTLNTMYGFGENKAYGTKKHMDGLLSHGPCVHHRNTFAPVVKCSRVGLN